MTREQLQRECDFGGAMVIADGLLQRGLITQKEHDKIEKLFFQKYSPVIAGSGQSPCFVS